VIAGEQKLDKDSRTPTAPITPSFPGYQQFGFPQFPNFQQLPFQLPIAQLQPLIATQGPVGDTGPAAVAIIGAGAAAGFSWMRRRRKK
jgi:LPXTG-motif cell wall-anchored protein